MDEEIASGRDPGQVDELTLERGNVIVAVARGDSLVESKEPSAAAAALPDPDRFSGAEVGGCVIR